MTVQTPNRSIGLRLVLAAPLCLVVSMVLGGPHGGGGLLLLLAMVLVPIGGLYCLVEIIWKRRWQNWGAWAGFVIALSVVVFYLVAND